MRRLMIGVVVGGSLVAALAVVGAVRLSRLLTGSARDPRSDLLLLAQDVGAQALPIVSLISSLVGVILAYVGAVEPQAFAAQVYVADLVGIAITRETGAMVMGVVMQWSPRSCVRILRASRCGTSTSGGHRRSPDERWCSVRRILEGQLQRKPWPARR